MALTPDRRRSLREARAKDAASSGCRSPGGWTSARVAGLIFAGALVVRLIYLWDASDSPTFRIPIVDARSYDELARGWVEHGRFTKGFFWQPLLYPVFLAAVYLFTNGSVVAARFVQLLIGAVTCALTYRLGERVLGRRAGVLAGVLTALCGPLLFLEAELVGAGLAAFWAVAVLLLMLRVRERPSPVVCGLLGASAALAILTRPTFVPFLALSGVWLVWQVRRALPSWSRAARPGAAVALGFLVIAAPAGIAAGRLTGRLTLLPSSGGINFYIGNSPDSAKLLTLRPGEEWDGLVQLPARQGISDMWAQQAYFSDRAYDYLRSQPLDFLAGLGQKTLQYFNSREIPRNIDIYLYRRWSALLGALVWRIGGFGFPFGVLLPLAILGCVTCWRRLPAPLWLFLLAESVAVILVFVAARYRVSILPAMCVLAAAGVYAIIEAVGGRRWTRLAVIAAASVVVVIGASWPGPFPQERQNLAAELYFGAAYRQIANNRPAEALLYLPEALRLDPENVNGHANYAGVLALARRYDEAIEEYQKVLELQARTTTPNPEQAASVHEALGRLLASQRKLEPALAHFQAAVAAQPGKGALHVGLGQVLLVLNRPAEAEAAFRQALALDPRLGAARVGLGRVLRGQGDRAGALEQFEEAVRLDGRNADARRELDALRAGP